MQSFHQDISAPIVRRLEGEWICNIKFLSRFQRWLSELLVLLAGNICVISMLHERLFVRNCFVYSNASVSVIKCFDSIPRIFGRY